MEPRREGTQQSNRLPRTVKKATTQEKGKWVPKVASKTTISYQEQLPSTSNNTTKDTTTTTATQIQNQPLTSTNPLDVVKQLVFILRTFNNKQVDAKWQQFMASKATSKEPSSAKALGSNLIQESPLAQHNSSKCIDCVGI